MFWAPNQGTTVTAIVKILLNDDLSAGLIPNLMATQFAG